MNFKIAIATAALLASQSFAIIGLGGHYAPQFGTEMKASAPESVTDGIRFSHGGFDGTLQGFGLKLWVDLLPIIDVEGTFNLQFGSYNANLFVDSPNGMTKNIPVEIELGGTPFGRATPKFVAMKGDISVTYPFTDLPIIRPYIGGGVTLNLTTFVLNKDFVSGLLSDNAVAELVRSVAELQGQDKTQIQQQAQELENKLATLGETLKKDIQEKALDEGLTKSVGGHVLVGFRLKLPVIPIAAYANFKYYIGGDYADEISTSNAVVEVGGGFAL